MTDSDSHAAASENRLQALPSKGGMFTRIGIVLLLVSCLLWLCLFAIPFLPLTLGQKAVVASVDFAIVQICWWTGAAMVGPQTMSRINAWRKRLKRSSPRRRGPE